MLHLMHFGIRKTATRHRIWNLQYYGVFAGPVQEGLVGNSTGLLGPW